MNAIDSLLNDNIKLPSPPAIAVRILDSVKKDDSSFKELSDIISTDPALTTKILRIANSSLYAVPSKVDNIQKALSLIGLTALKNIALSFVMAGSLKKETDGGFDFDLFWKSAITSAVGAELIAKKINLRSDDTFVTALLQDIGVLILHFCKPDEYAKVLDEKRNSNDSVYKIEKRILGFDHSQLGFEILKKWGLPESIYKPISYHYEDTDIPDEFSKQVDVLTVSNIVSAAYHGVGSTVKIQEIKNILSEKYDLSDEQVDEYIDEVAEKSIDLLSDFEIDPGDMKPYSQILLEANEELGKLNLSYEQLVVEYKQAKEEAEKLAQNLSVANDKLREMVIRDGLTGLYNHRHFQDVMDKELSAAERYGKRLSIILFDIDHFKKVNDTYGHPSGDIVLKQVSALLSDMVRTCDVVARYGGEEFAAILPETDNSGAVVLAERMRSSVEKLDIVANDITIKITISLGVTTFIPKVSATNKADIIDAADKALYQSKETGRNKISVMNSTRSA